LPSRVNGIYLQSCSDVIVWLGYHADESASSHPTCYWPDTMSTEHIGRRSLARMCDEEYWKRVWIVQEIGLASRILVIFFSSDCAIGDWDDLGKALNRSLEARWVSRAQAEPVMKLVTQRKQRHGDKSRLE
jgi:hypothetical protein